MKWGGKKYLTETKPGYVFVRRHGKYTRIHAPYPSREFDAEYWAILNGNAKTSKTSFKEAFLRYRQSDRFQGLSPRSRKDYRQKMDYLEGIAGKQDITRMQRKHVIGAMVKAEEAKGTRFANYLQSVLSVVFENCIDLGWMNENPAKGVRKLRIPEENKKPHVPWPKWAIEKWRNEAGPRELLIFELSLGTGQRPGDIPDMMWSHVGADGIKVAQNKTKKRLTIPLTKRLEAALRATEKVGTHIITGQHGKPLSQRRIAEIMVAERKRLGCFEFDLHALRYTATRELFEAGCDKDMVKAVTGHSTDEMLALYGGDVMQFELAKRAQGKRK